MENQYVSKASANKGTPEKKKFGTRELSGHSYNVIMGCMHDCRYCWAKHYAAKNKSIQREDWQHQQVVFPKCFDETKLFDGTVMFPTTHDITPGFDEACLCGLLRLLEAGNQVLVCTKANLYTAEYFTKNLQKYKDQLTFMITITSLDERASAFWEPNAPMPVERITSLKLYHESGYKTSVLVEPMLDGVGDTIKLYDMVTPHVTEEIWFGLMMYASERVNQSDPDNVKMLEILQLLHSEANINFLYSMLNDKEKVRWKSSIVEVIANRADFQAMTQMDFGQRFDGSMNKYPRMPFKCAKAEFPRY